VIYNNVENTYLHEISETLDKLSIPKSFFRNSIDESTITYVKLNNNLFRFMKQNIDMFEFIKYKSLYEI